MATTAPLEDAEPVTLEQLRENWPAWHIRQSGPSQLWKATRSAKGTRPGCTLIEDTASKLLAELHHQVELDARNAVLLPPHGW
ncbi:hypothetical protein [Actinocorallia longicatena]|uniref:Uncharacterized protein n=1 Tax=Actinocorallia longicatena TaxID=111803 RepID=A0ABP6QHM2_9ACTN